MHRLPVVSGWTVDCRLSEFRKVKWVKGTSSERKRFGILSETAAKSTPTIEYVPFDSTKGRRLIKRMGYEKFRRACGNV